MSKGETRNTSNRGLGRLKQLVHERDDYCCTDCGRHESEVEKLDIDHIVPRHRGGADCLSNLVTQCRQCHDAKHESGLAPTIEWESTGAMTEYEFMWFKHYHNEMLPAIGHLIGEAVVLRPRFDLGDRDRWHYPVGNLKTLDGVLDERVDHYRAMNVAAKM